MTLRGKRMPPGQGESTPQVEELEPRLLFSADAVGLLAPDSLSPEQPATEILLDENLEPVLPAPRPAEAEEERLELVFVDTDTPDYQALVTDLLTERNDGRRIDVVLLDNSRDGIDQISETLQSRQGVDAIHLISHGSEGTVELGASKLNAENLPLYEEQLRSWGQSLDTEADILIYGCNLTAGPNGQSLVDRMASLTGADIAASNDLTGHQSLGGDWNLETQTGEIESQLVVSASLQQAWQGLLVNEYVVSTNADSGAGSLRQAIIDANASANSGGPDVISFDIGADGSQQTINLLSALDPISEAVTIDGFSQYGALTPSSPLIEINGAATGGANGFTFQSGSDGSTVQGVMITRFDGFGIQVDSGADGIQILGNWIGTTGTGTVGDGNGNNGINVQGANTLIGGTGVNDGNVITNNGNEGINLTGSGATGTIIQGNIIGLDPDGATGSGNTDVGIALLSGSHNTTIGGTDPNAGNVISMNYEGIEINSNNNTVQGNYIGTDITGTLDRGNRSDDGIEIQNSATGNLIGGTDPNAGNLIAFNALDGINIVNGSGNTLLGNEVHSNGDQDIDLGAGANNAQAAPTLSAAFTNGSQINITGSLNSTADSFFRVEFFGAGQTYLGFANVATDGSGNASFNVQLNASTTAGDAISASATMSEVTYTSFTDTSELSASTIAVATSLAPDATTSGNSAGGSFLLSHTTTGLERLMLVSVSLTQNGGGEQVSAMTYNGAGLTKVGQQVQGSARVEIWSLVNPDLGTHNLDITMSGTALGVTAGVTTFTGVDQLAPLGSFDSRVGTSNSGSLTISSATNEMVFSAVSVNSATNWTLSMALGQTKLWEEFSDQTNGAASTEPGAPSQGSGWSWGTSADYVIGVIAIKPTNSPPGITSDGGGATAAVNVSEHATPVTTVTATDPDPDTLSFSIDGASDDAAFFSIDGTGNLAFLAAPDFETPADLDGDNVYEVRVEVSDGRGGLDTQDISVTVTDALELVVTNTNATGAGSLHQAILDANANTGLTDLITFNIGGGGPQTILVDPAGLPDITDAVVLDATSQPGYSGTPLITLDGSSVPPASGINGITVRANDSTVKGFIVINFPDEGIEIDGSTGYGDNNTVQGNWVGIDKDSNLAGNTGHGIMVTDHATGNLIGGTGTNEGNVVGASGLSGIVIRNNSDNNVVEGNTVGLKVDGSSLAGNADHGILVSFSSDYNRIGGAAAGAGNLISGNDKSGIHIDGATDATYTVATQRNLVLGNYIGTDQTGDNQAGNDIQDTGITVLNSGWNTIGGSSVGEANVISGNRLRGVLIEGNNAYFTTVQGNFIGTNSDGSAALTNVGPGQQIGVYIYDSYYNTIGGTAAGEGNILSGNITYGLYAWGPLATVNLIQGNTIGLDALGTTAIGNGGVGGGGIFLSSAPGNLLSGNTVSGHLGTGVAITGASAIDNTLLGNVIYDNDGLGIDLNADGVSPNDGDDADTGANNTQNFPAISSAILTGTDLAVDGSLDTDLPSTEFLIEFFGNDAGTEDPTHGEGRNLLGSVTVTTDVLGDASFSGVTLTGVSQLHGDFISATATRVVNPGLIGTDDAGAYGETSEFAANLAIVRTNQQPVITSDGGLATAAIALDENESHVTQVVVSDPDLDSPIFSLTGGADLIHFDIDASSGLLTFKVPPDFENPVDTGADNSYQVEVTADDGYGGSDSQMITVTVSNDAPIANAAWFDESDGGGGYADFPALAAAHAAYMGTTEQTIDLESLSQGDVLSNQYVGSHGVTFSNTGVGASQIYAEGGGWIENITGYDGSYAADGSNVYLKMDNEDPLTPLTIEFATPVAKVGALLGMGIQGTNHDVNVRLYDSGDNLIDQRTLTSELWDGVSQDQNYETFFGVSYDTAVISKIEILNASNVDYANALIIDQLSWSVTPDAADSYTATTAVSVITGNVLANDIDPAGGALSVSGFTQGANGVVSYNGDGTFTYTSDQGFTGADSFTYTVMDAGGLSDTATVSIAVSNNAPVMTDWFDSAWETRKTFTIAAANVPADVLNFPVLITLNTDSELAAQALANGDDILFTAADGITQLAHEIEFFDETTGELRVWVKTDLSGSVDTNLYMYFGNTASAPQENAAGVWDNYVGVYHLEESPTGAPGELVDSSGSGNDAFTQGAMDAADLVATPRGQGLEFDGANDMIRIPDSVSLDSINDEATFSLWINFVDAADGDHQLIMSSSNRFSATDGYEWGSQGSGNHFFYPDAATPDGNYNLGANPFSNGSWHHLAVTMDYSTKEVIIYVDGSPMTFSYEGVPGNWIALSSSDDILFGGNPDRATRFFNGIMDEIRIADVARSQDWIQTEVNNQSAPATFVSLGVTEDRQDPLTDINEDDFTSAGDSVLSILNSSGADRITDPDTGALEGIAVSAVDDSNGQWQYDANADGTWLAFAGVTDSNAVLLDTGALIRFVPSADYNGNAGDLTYRAWDQTSGTNGDTGVNVSANGGSTAYSSETFVASLDVIPVNDAPDDLYVVGSSSGGLNLNNDGGNDTYFVADDGAGLLGGLTAVTIETRFSVDTPAADNTTLFSYADGGNDEELALFIKNDGTLWFLAHSPGAIYQATTSQYPQLFDGEEHHIAVSWDSLAGDVVFYIDGQLEESFSGYQSGEMITGGGQLVFGQDQDSELGGFNPIDTFSGTLFEVRVFDDVRTAGEIAGAWNTVIPAGTAGLIADWRFDNLSQSGVVTELVSGNNLTEQHVGAGGGFSTSQPDLPLVVSEAAANGELVGTIRGIDRDIGDILSYSLIDNAGSRFAIDPASGALTVVDGSLLNVDNNTSHSITVRVSDGSETYDEVFTVQVVASDRPPAGTVPAAQSVDEDGTLVFSIGNGNAISVTDDSGEMPTVTLSVGNGALTVSGLGSAVISGDGTANLTLTGTVADINLALNGLQYDPTGDYNGADTLVMTTTDGEFHSFNIDASLQGYYEYTGAGPAADSSPAGGNDGSLSGDATIINDPDRGEVLSLDGSGDYLDVPGMVTTGQNVTLSAWVNLAGGAGTGEVIDITSRLSLRLDSVQGVQGSFWDGTSTRSTNSGVVLAGTGWHHVAYTVDTANNVQNLYLDGNIVATSYYFGSVVYAGGDSHTYIGSTQGATNFFDGALDETRIFDRVLSAVEIGQLASIPAVAQDTDTVAITVNPMNDPPTGSVTIDNVTPAQGDTLTASNTLADVDGLGAITYTWKADGVTVGTGGSYTLTQAEVGAAITVEAAYTDGDGTNEIVASSATAAVTNVNDAPTGSVTIDNTTPAQGDTLTASNTLADLDGLGAITYTWKADGVTVATGGSYTLTQADVGTVITVEATYTDGGGTNELVASAPTAAVSNVNDAPSGAVTIDNTTPVQGDTLTASNTLADVDGLGAITYTWKSFGVTVGFGTSYTLTQAEVGTVITVEASYTDGYGANEVVASAGTAAVINVNDAPTGSVTIDNTTPTEGDTLTASNTLSDLDGLGAITYTWKADGVTVDTGGSYTLTQAEVGTIITVEASYTDGYGASELVASAGTAAVANLNNAPSGAVTIDNTSPAQGDTLTASNTLADADGLGAITYTWKADGATVGTGGSYTLTQAEVGTVITVEASYTDGEGSNELVGSAGTAAVTNINDAPTGSVTIDNTTPTEGDTLSASNTLADLDGLGAITYTWKADGVTVGTGGSYTLTPAEVGTVITVEASYTDGYGANEVVASAGTAAVANLNYAPSGAVTIDNTSPAQGDTLTASNTLADADGLGAITYTWKADGVTVGTGGSYTLTQAEVGTVITLEATYTDGGGTNELVASAPTAAVTNVNDLPTGSVTIDNTTPGQGDTITASNTLADDDGLGAITYTWKADGVTVGTGTSYTLTPVEIGTVITVEASYIDGYGASEVIASAGTAAVANLNSAPTGAVTIDNAMPAQGDTLTASNTLADADGLGAITYTWKADGVTVATGGSYTLTQAEVGTVITVEASYTDGYGSNEVVSSAGTAAVTNVNDAPTGAVTIDNTSPAQGDTLTASNTLADADGLGALTLTWFADGFMVGAGNSHTLTQFEVGRVITVEATYVDGEGTLETVISAATAAVTNVNDAPTGLVTIDNLTPAQGDTLTASNTLADADGLGPISYTWKADGVMVGTGSTYTLIQADVGRVMTVEATYTDSYGFYETVASAGTDPVTNVNDAPTGSVTIDNTTPFQGDTLAASNDLADVDGMGPVSYQWQRDGADVVGATGSTYMLGEPDVGAQISVVASFVDGYGFSESVTSAAVGPVANVNDSPTGQPLIAGIPTEGEILSVDTGSISDADGMGVLGYQWQGSTDGGETWIDLVAGDQFQLSASEAGMDVRVTVSYVDARGAAESLSSESVFIIPTPVLQEILEEEEEITPQPQEPEPPLPEETPQVEIVEEPARETEFEPRVEDTDTLAEQTIPGGNHNTLLPQEPLPEPPETETDVTEVLDEAIQADVQLPPEVAELIRDPRDTGEGWERGDDFEFSGGTISRAEAAHMDAVLNSHAMWQQIASMKRQIDGEDLTEEQLVVQYVSTGGAGLVAGMVAYALRGGALVASVLGTMPAWAAFDPLPVLKSSRKRKDEVEEDAREGSAEPFQTEVEGMFD